MRAGSWLTDILSEKASDGRASRRRCCGFRHHRHRDCLHRHQHGSRRHLNCDSAQNRNATEPSNCGRAQSSYGWATGLNRSETELNSFAGRSNCAAESIRDRSSRSNCAAEEHRSVRYWSSRSDCRWCRNLAP